MNIVKLSQVNMWCLVLLVVSTVAGTADAIIGGTPQFSPSAVSIFLNHFPSCSGTILDPRFVITAAHCFDVPGEYDEQGYIKNYKNNGQPVTKIRIHAGVSDLTSQGGIDVGVKKVTIHPNYERIFNVDQSDPRKSRETLHFDLAILELDTMLTLSDKIQAAELPPHGINYTNSKVKAGGWGIITKRSRATMPSKDHLVIDVPINPDDTCRAAYPHPYEYEKSQMFCIGDSDKTTCAGDDGTAAIYTIGDRKIILGVLSYGGRICNTPGVFHKIEVSKYWILHVTQLRYV